MVEIPPPMVCDLRIRNGEIGHDIRILGGEPGSGIIITGDQFIVSHPVFFGRLESFLNDHRKTTRNETLDQINIPTHPDNGIKICKGLDISHHLKRADVLVINLGIIWAQVGTGISLVPLPAPVRKGHRKGCRTAIIHLLVFMDHPGKDDGPGYWSCRGDYRCCLCWNRARQWSRVEPCCCWRWFRCLGQSLVQVCRCTQDTALFNIVHFPLFLRHKHSFPGRIKSITDISA